MPSAYRTLWIAAILSFLATFGIALPYPVLTPLMVAAETQLNQWLGLDPKILLGLVLAAYPLGMLLGANLIGGWSDRWGRRKVLLWTLGGAILGYGLSVVAILSENFTWLLISRLLTGFCEGNVAVVRAIAADLGDRIPRTQIFAWAMTATFLGWTFGPLAGGLLLDFGADKVFIAGTGFLVLGWLIVAMALDNEPAKHTHQGKGQQALSLYLTPDIRDFALVHFMACMAINAFYQYYPLWLVEAFATDGMGIAKFTIALQAGMLGSSMFLMRRLERRFGLRSAMHGSLAILSLSLLGVPLLSQLALVALLFIVIGVVNSSFFGLFMSDYSERFQEYGQGRILGLATLNFSLSSMLMALVGAAVSLIGPAWALAMGGVLGLTALVYLLSLQTRQTTPAPVINE